MLCLKLKSRPDYNHTTPTLGERVCIQCKLRGLCAICGGKLHRGEKDAHGCCQPHFMLNKIVSKTYLPDGLHERAVAALDAANKFLDIELKLKRRM